MQNSWGEAGSGHRNVPESFYSEGWWKKKSPFRRAAPFDAGWGDSSRSTAPAQTSLLAIRVSHPVYGQGTVTNKFDHASPKCAGIGESKNAITRHKGTLNLVVIFDKGGPQGWAENSSNDTKELTFL